MHKHETNAGCCIALEDIITPFEREPGRVPSSYDAWNVGRYADKLKELGFEKVANQYRERFFPIYQQRAIIYERF